MPHNDGERYLVPEALPKNSPYLGNRTNQLLRFRYQYDFLPSNLIPRLIVQSHRNVLQGKPRWRGGVMLTVRNCEVLVTANTDHRFIDLEIEGLENLRRAALNIVRDDMEAVHDLNPEAKPIALVPLWEEPEFHVSYEHLERLEQERGPDWEYWPDGAKREYTISELLDGVRQERRPRRTNDPTGPVKTETHLVVLIHGISTRALWQGPVKKTLERSGLKVELTNFGRLDLVRFLCLIPIFRHKIADEIAQQIRQASRLNGGGKCSVIAHSFGTYILATLLQRHPDLYFRKIIFCGSVVRYDFPFAKYTDPKAGVVNEVGSGPHFEAPLMNDVGSRDIWPVLAETTTYGYGSAGTYGFHSPGVYDRWHNGLAHGDFLNPKFCEDFWVPFLTRGEIVESDENPAAPAIWLKALGIIRYLLAFTLPFVGWWCWRHLPTAVIH